MRVPPGVRPGDFSDALSQFAGAVGKDWVFTSEDDVDLYRDSYSPFWHEDEEPIPAAAVAPDGVEQVQKVVRIANRYKIPLWTISTGKNLGYGGSAPLLGGTVVLDLKRMDRILEVNDKNHYALVEPGVSYFDLYRYIQEKGLKVWIDPADPGWGSLIGNAVDRGGGRTPMRDHFDAHCGMEVVLSNGEVLRTGMGALPGSKTWQQYRYGFGPYVDGIFSQSNFGVVTKMGFWLFPEPEAYLTGVVTVPKRDDLIPLVAGLAYLMNSGIVLGTTSVASPLDFLQPDAELASLRARQGGPSTVELENYLRDKSLGYWSIELPFYGPSRVVAAQWEYAQEKFSAIAGVRFREGVNYRFPLGPGDVAQFPNSVAVGIPSLSVFGVGGGRSEGHVWFSPIVPMTGEAVLEAQKVFSDAYEEMGVAKGPLFFLGPASNYPRCFLVLFGFPIEHDVAKNRKNRESFKRLIKVAAEHGWGEYRTHTAFMESVMDTYSFNNHALRRFHESIKDAVDPNGILAPGKCGIWPKHLRKATA
ncbi:MAG TPA: FAD-binding oxidoreductase [Candidatus Acidoferrales bacterium]|nr:FAD-binding oxidoreductase [Candidatus Acidoferrales bacterium]